MENKQIMILGIVAILAIVFLVFLFHGQIVANAVTPGGFKMPGQKKFDAGAMHAQFLKSAQAAQGAYKGSSPAWMPMGAAQGKSTQLPYFQQTPQAMPKSYVGHQQDTLKKAYEKQQEAVHKAYQVHQQKMAAIRSMRS